MCVLFLGQVLTMLGLCAFWTGIILGRITNITMTDTDNLSPIYIHRLISKIEQETLKNGSVTAGLQELLNKVKKVIPLPTNKRYGKYCKNRQCGLRMHSKTIRCPKCHTIQRDRKKQIPKKTTKHEDNLELCSNIGSNTPPPATTNVPQPIVVSTPDVAGDKIAPKRPRTSSVHVSPPAASKKKKTTDHRRQDKLIAYRAMLDTW